MMITTQGRGSAIVPILLATILIMGTTTTHLAEAATFVVGGSGGWTFNLDSWPKGKAFRAGDSLLFKYDPSIHNVVAVDRGGYGSCGTPAGAKVYKSGKDVIRLKKGLNFFICNFPGHCESGMKVAINAT